PRPVHAVDRDLDAVEAGQERLDLGRAPHALGERDAFDDPARAVVARAGVPRADEPLLLSPAQAAVDPRPAAHSTTPCRRASSTKRYASQWRALVRLVIAPPALVDRSTFTGRTMHEHSFARKPLSAQIVRTLRTKRAEPPLRSLRVTGTAAPLPTQVASTWHAPRVAHRSPPQHSIRAFERGSCSPMPSLIQVPASLVAHRSSVVAAPARRCPRLARREARWKRPDARKWGRVCPNTQGSTKRARA